MSHNLPPLPPDVNKLLDDERARPVPDAAALARIKNRLHASVAAGAMVDLPRDSSSWTHALSWTHVVGAASIVGLVVGGAWIVQPRVGGPVTSVEVPVMVVPQAQPLVKVVVEPAPADVVEEQPAPVSAPRRREVPPVAAVPEVTPENDPVEEAAPTEQPVQQDVAQEHHLLEKARMHLQGERVEEARRAVEEHAARFPHGRLVEEREALHVVVLARGGKVDEAREAAAAFKAAHRRSLFQPLIDQALQH